MARVGIRGGRRWRQYKYKYKYKYKYYYCYYYYYYYYYCGGFGQIHGMAREH